MKQSLVFFLFLSVFLLSEGLQAQGKGERIRQARKEFVAKRVKLSAEQEKKFWPLYDEYSQEKHQLFRQRRKERIEVVSLAASDAELLEAVEQLIVLREKEVQIEREYLEKFKKVLQPRQLVEFYRADSAFSKKLLELMKE